MMQLVVWLDVCQAGLDLLRHVGAHHVLGIEGVQGGAMNFILSKKWTARKERPSRRMDFRMSSTLQPVHGGIVGHHHLVIHVSLGRRHTELDEANL